MPKGKLTRLLAVDPGSRTTGIAVLHGGQLIYYDTLDANPKLDFGERRILLREQITATMVTVAPVVDSMIIEEPMGAGIKAIKQYTVIKTMIEEDCIRVANIPFATVHPMSWRALVKRRAQITTTGIDMKQLAREQFDIATKDDPVWTGEARSAQAVQDVVDAYWIGRYAYETFTLGLTEVIDEK